MNRLTCNYSSLSGKYTGHSLLAWNCSSFWKLKAESREERMHKISWNIWFILFRHYLSMFSVPKSIIQINRSQKLFLAISCFPKTPCSRPLSSSFCCYVITTDSNRSVIFVWLWSRISIQKYLFIFTFVIPAFHLPACTRQAAISFGVWLKQLSACCLATGTPANSSNAACSKQLSGCWFTGDCQHWYMHFFLSNY